MPIYPFRPNPITPPGANSPGVGLEYTLNQTDLDQTSPFPNGGPNHFPQYDHQHTYTENNKYLDNFEAAASQNSAFGIVGRTLNPTNTFNDPINGTNLDVESPLPDGGPNRNNAGTSNIPSGQYNNINYNTGETLSTTMVHEYTPDNKYEDSFQAGTLPNNSTF